MCVRSHGRPGGSRHGLVVHAGFGVHSLDGDNVSQTRIRAGLGQLGLAGVWARKVGNEVQVLALGSRDAEGLLHETIGLVAVAIWLAIVGHVVATASRVRCLAGASS